MLNETVAVNLFGMNAEDVAKRNTAEREKNAAKARRKRSAAEKKAHKEKMAKAQLKDYDEIEVLANERAAWQENAYKASNLQLYAVLQKCYDLYVRTERKTEDATNLRKAIDAYAESKKYRFIGKGNAITRIVKCVFGADRRRVSAYSIVLRAVFKKHNGAADVAQFIKDNGGVEEIRLGAAKNAKTVKQKAADAVDT